ncbi:MAG: aminodeoxychorismate lyase [Roseivirga sp.]
MKAIYNSRILPEEEIELQIRNRAFCYGDGLFETIVTGPDRINLLSYHIARLTDGCKVLDLQIPFSEQQLEQLLKSLETANNLMGDIRYRIQLWRQEGGLYEPVQKQSSYLITAAESTAPFYSKAGSLSVAQKAKLSWHALSFAKTMSALPYVLAGLERKQSAYDELVLTDGIGNIAECVASNIFWVKGEKVFTPQLQSGCVKGTMREFILSRFALAGQPIKEVMEPLASLLEADQVFISNASGIKWVSRFEDKADFSDPGLLLKRVAILPQQP